MKKSEKTWGEVYSQIEMEKSTQANLISDRIKKAEDFDFEEITFPVDKGRGDGTHENLEIPEGFVMAGIRF